MAKLTGQEALDWIKNNQGKGYVELDDQGKTKTWYDMDRGFLGNIGTSLLNPFMNLSKLTAAGVDAVSNPGKRTNYLTEDEHNNLGRLILQTAAGIGSYAVPVGGASTLLGNVGRGAISGAMGSFGASDITKDIDPGQIALGAGIGGAVPIVMKGVGGILNKMKGKAAAKTAENVGDDVLNTADDTLKPITNSVDDVADDATKATSFQDKWAQMQKQGMVKQGGGYISQNPVNVQIENAAKLTDPAQRTKAFVDILRNTDSADPLYNTVKSMAKMQGVSDDVIQKAVDDNLDAFIDAGLKKYPNLQKYMDDMIPEGSGGLTTSMPDDLAYNKQMREWIAESIRTQERGAARKLAEEATRKTEEAARLQAVKNAPPTSTKMANVKTVFDDVTPEQYTKMSGLSPKKLEMSAIIDDYKRAGFQITGQGPNSFDDFIKDINIAEKYRIANKLPRTPEGIKQAIQISGKDIGNLRAAAQGTGNIKSLIDDAASFGQDRFPRTADKVRLAETLQNDLQGVYGTVMDDPNLSAQGLGEVKKALQQYRTMLSQTTGVDRYKLLNNPEFMARIRLSELVDDELNRLVGTASGAREAGQMYRVGMQQGENIDRVMNKIDPQTNLPTTQYQLLNEAGRFVSDKSNAVKEFAGRALQGKNPLGAGGGPGILSRMSTPAVNVPQSVINTVKSPVTQTIGANLFAKSTVPPKAGPESAMESDIPETDQSEIDMERQDREEVLALWQQMINAGASYEEINALMGPQLAKYGIGGSKGSAGTAKQQQQAMQIKNARNVLNSFVKQLEKMGTQESGVLARITGAGRKLAGTVGLDSDVKNYEDLKKALITPLARAMGETGVITNADIDRYGSLLPDLSESTDEWQNKIAQIMEMLNYQEQSIGLQ